MIGPAPLAVQVIVNDLRFGLAVTVVAATDLAIVAGLLAGIALAPDEGRTKITRPPFTGSP
jgi:hypothetical protein